MKTPIVMVEALLWLALLSPLQLVLLGHSANQVIGNLSLLGLMLLRMGRRVGESGVSTQESGVSSWSSELELESGGVLSWSE